MEQEHYFNSAIMNGAIPICHLGCALWQWLVVNGEHWGFVWSDYRVDHRGIFPIYDKSGRQMTFSDWYMSWLDESLQTAKIEGGVVGLLSRGKTQKAVRFYEEQTGSELEEAERAVKYIATRYRVGGQGSRRQDLLTALMLIALGALLGVVLGWFRG